MLNDWVLRLRSLFKRSAVERDLDDELQFHLEEQVASYMRQGLLREQAVRRARLEFGGLDQIKEDHRDARGTRLVEDFGRDVRHAVRQLRRSPGFAAAAILCLSLGIGAATAISSVVITILLQPLPFRDSDRLVRVVENYTSSAPGRPVMQRGIPYQEFLDWRDHATTFTDAAAVLGSGQRLVRSRYGATGLWSAALSLDAFTMFGVRATVGRTFDTSDANWLAVVVLTHDTWQRHFNADPGVVGTVVEVSAATLTDPDRSWPLTVIGVLPAEFELPTGQADYYTPIVPPNSSSQALPVTMIGRLAPDASLDAATAELNAMATMTAFEAKARFGELLDRVAQGEEVVITRHDKPIARLVPEGAPRLEDVRRAVSGLRELQQRIRRRTRTKLSDAEVRAAIDSGRL